MTFHNTKLIDLEKTEEHDEKERNVWMKVDQWSSVIVQFCGLICIVFASYMDRSTSQVIVIVLYPYYIQATTIVWYACSVPPVGPA